MLLSTVPHCQCRTWNYVAKGHIIYKAEREIIKNRPSFCSVFFLSLLNTKSIRRGVQLVPIVMPIVCWKTLLLSIVNMLSIKTSIIMIMSVSENFLLESFDSFFCVFFYINMICPFPFLRWPFLFMQQVQLILFICLSCLTGE